MDNMVSVPREEYNELILAQSRLDYVRTLALNDGDKYGYSSNTSRMIDFVLGIERKEKAD